MPYYVLDEKRRLVAIETEPPSTDAYPKMLVLYSDETFTIENEPGCETVIPEDIKETVPPICVVSLAVLLVDKGLISATEVDDAAKKKRIKK